MLVNLIEVPRPMVSSFTMFAKPDLNLFNPFESGIKRFAVFVSKRERVV